MISFQLTLVKNKSALICSFYM